jgi:hypothetical protein
MLEFMGCASPATDDLDHTIVSGSGTAYNKVGKTIRGYGEEIA